MGSGDHLSKRGSLLVQGCKPNLATNAGLLEQVGDGMLKRVRPCPIDVLHPVVVRDLLIEFF